MSVPKYLNNNRYPSEGNGGGEASTEKERLILQYSGMVKFMALRLIARLPDNISADDLFSSGIIGLIDAIDKFDASQGIPFKHYAKIRVRGAMLDEIRSMDWIPRSLRQKGTMLEKACIELEHRLDRFPTDEEIAGELGIGMAEYHRLLDEIKGISLLPENVHDTLTESREFHSLATNSDESFHNTYIAEIRTHLAEAITFLSEKEQLVLSLYYHEELTMKEIGAALGYTESRISQIHSKAVLKLRTKLAKRFHQDDLPGSSGMI